MALSLYAWRILCLAWAFGRRVPVWFAILVSRNAVAVLLMLFQIVRAISCAPLVFVRESRRLKSIKAALRAIDGRIFTQKVDLN